MEGSNQVLVLVPMNLDAASFPRDDGKAAEAKTRLAADSAGWASGQVRIELELEKNVKALRAGDGGCQPASTSKL
jgi:hypothetical protein